MLAATNRPNAGTFDNQANRHKILRIASVILSVLFHLVIILALFLNPIKIMAFAEPSAAVVGSLSASQNDGENTQAKANTAIDKMSLVSEESVNKPEIAKGQGAGRPQETRSDASAPKPITKLPLPLVNDQIKTEDSEIDVAETVSKLIGSASDEEPIDFLVLDGMVVAQVSTSAVSSLTNQLTQNSEAGDTNCAAVRTIQEALQADIILKEALLKIPRNERSVANVIMAWDGRWIGSHASGTSINGPDDLVELPTVIRDRIQEHVRRNLSDCLNQIMTGPHFILIEDQIDPTILTIGSGEWTWNQLIAPDKQIVDGLDYNTVTPPIAQAAPF